MKVHRPVYANAHNAPYSTAPGPPDSQPPSGQAAQSMTMTPTERAYRLIRTVIYRSYRAFVTARGAVRRPVATLAP
ncbi:hypothetical protein [Streptomyces sp. NRRL S-813]|uniref:hypothetical protein n=1 Tax=Streptomyces sp. NRRL S-813 TaxID=1463919 RepID=UPI00131AD1AB|nr:hypothetical protein [Streptomyces sp. NRRL S-813]